MHEFEYNLHRRESGTQLRSRSATLCVPNNPSNGSRYSPSAGKRGRLTLGIAS